NYNNVYANADSGSASTTIGSDNVVSTLFTEGTSGIGQGYSLVYYIKDSSDTYAKIGTSVSEVNSYISTLDDGTYTLYTCLTDTKITVLKDTDEFTKSSAPTSYTGLSVDKTGSGTVTISADNCTIGDSVDISATPETGYTFTEWTATNGTLGSATTANTTFTPSANNAKATATFTENLYDVTVDNGDTTTPVKAGVDTHPSITAADKTGYKFTGWSTTGGATVADNTANGKTTTVSATAAGTVTATYTEITYARLYYSNPNNWTTIKAYVWQNSNESNHNAAWSGEDITTQKETINGVDYYYVEFDSSKGYDRVIFNNGNSGSGNQTGNLSFTEDNYGQFSDNNNKDSTNANWTTLPTNKPLLDITDGTTDTHGSIEGFYSDSGYTNAITQAREGDKVYVKVTANTGYKLNTLTAGSTDIKTNKYFDMPSSAVTVTATFAEDRSTSYTLVFDTGSTSSYAFEKKSGETASSICYAEVTLNKGTTYKFKIHSTSGTKYGNKGTMTSASSGQKWSFTSGEVSCGITPSVTGTYIFKWDYSDSSKKQLTVTFPSYTATIVAGDNGSVSTESINGATVVTATADDGYVFDGWVTNDDSLVQVADKDSASTTITPLATGGTVTAKFAVAYTVTVTGIDYTPTAYKVGANVTINLPANTGETYEVTLPEGVTDTNEANGVIEFVMPAKDVSISVVTLYPVRIAEASNGTVSVNSTSAKANDTITVTATANDGYEIDKIKVNGNEITGNTFTMPAQTTTVTVTFKETLHKVTITNNVNSTTSTKQVGKITAVDISAEVITGYTFKNWTATSGITIEDSSSASTTITASAAGTVTANYDEDLSTNFVLSGNFGNGWKDYNFTKNQGEATSQFSYARLNLTGGQTYEFGLKINGKWYANTGTMTYDNCTGWTFEQKSNTNCKITTQYEGTYIFQFDSSTNKLSVIYPEQGETTKYELTINAPTPIDSYVTNYSVTYTVDREEKSNVTVAKGGKIQVDEGSAVTITANEIVSAVDSSDIVSVESWFVNGSEDKTQNTKVLTLSNVTQNTTVYPKVYGKISVSSITVANTDDVNVNPTATVVMGKSADQAGGSTKYKPVVKVRDSLGNVNTFYGAVVDASAITAGEQYTFAPITITGLSKGSYTVTAEIIGYNDSDTQVAYGASAEKAMDYGYSYKETAYTGDVAWVDAVPSYNGGDKATLIKWNNHTGSNQDTNGKPYVFYLPNSVDMSNVTIYHNFSSLTIGSQTITSGSSYSFDTNKEYSFTSNKSTGKVKFMKGSQNSTQLYLTTTNADGTVAYDLPTKTDSTLTTKGSVECVGNSIAVDQTGNVNPYKVKKLKGRGNSSWEASYKLFGKYAYNITLKDSVSLFGLAGDNKNGNTKYSLLANNVDEAQVRNSYIYKLAKELGYEYFPNFQMADVYDNGVYMGSYLVCQKVELGKKGMITEPEIKYDDPVDEAGNTVDFTLQTGTYDGCSYQYSSNRVDSTNYNSGGTYLMEFELNERYTAEASWFISKKNQAIVVASPENASQNEMKFIIDKWNTVEAAVYGGNIDSVRDKIDVESFAKMYLIQELTKNLDACSTSYNILYKSAEDKFYAEPVWDYDWTLGQYANDPKTIIGSHSDTSTDLDATDGFFARYKSQGGNGDKYDFEAQLCQNASFWSDVETIWTNEFYDTATSVNTYLINSYVPGIKDTILMNENRWGFIASDPSTGWGSKDTADTFDGVANYTTDWITARLTWLNGKITPTMYTVSAGKGATMTYMDNMGNGKLNAYTQFAKGTKLTFTAARQPGMEFQGWSTSTDGTTIDTSLSTTDLTITVPVSKSATYTPVFAMTYTKETTPVTYYVDMHGDSNLVPTINFADGDTLTLTKVGSSTVYSGSYNTKYYVDDNKKLVDIATKISTISAGGKNLALTSANALTKKCLETGEVWIEATQSIKDAQATNNSTQAKGATITNGTTKRIYWGNKGAWASSQLFNPPAIYYWTVKSDGSKTEYVDWGSAPKMTNISGDNYYYDVPKDVNRVIFKDGSGQTVDITVTDTSYAFSPYNKHEKTDGKYNASPWGAMPADPTPISYTSSYELYDDDTTGTHSIAPTLNPNATATYSVANENIATVNATGVITPKAIGTTKVTIIITGTSNDTATVETTIKVIDRPVIATPAYAIMSYNSNTSSFQAVGGTLGTLTTKLTGSAYNGVTTGGIIDGNTVKYAIADPTVTAYADLAVTVTAPSSGNVNYVFMGWTKNNNAISGATETLTVTLNTASTDKYIVTYQLDSVQVVFTYNFVDYDTSGGYEYVENGPTKAASYKTAPKTVHASAIKQEGNGYVVTEELQNAAETNMPNIISNYFRYSLDKTTVSAPTMVDGIYYVTATMTNTARTFAVSVNGTKVGDYTFQKEVVLDATNAEYGVSESNTGYVWTIKDQVPQTPISDKKVYTLKVAGDVNLKVAHSDGSKTIKNLSAINATFHEIKTNNNKNYVGQNFYIQNFYRQNDPVYDENGNEVADATNKTFEGAGVLSYNATYDSTTKTYKPVSATVRNFDYTNKTSLLNVAKDIGVEATDNSASNSIHTASGLNYSFVKGSDTVDNVTGQTFMKYSQTQGCYSYFYQAVTEQSKLYRSQYYVVYSYYVYSYMLNGVKTYVYVMSDQYATAKVYAS
ncbi:MAG: CotH kinase family protein, partial [Oscillospiraceae bacterium]|nr:CotH kinase family protein [Oscillospiraceae bacterium]